MTHFIRARAEVGSQEAAAALDALLQGLVGPPLIGTVLAAILLGIFMMQTYIYYKHFAADRRPLKLMVRCRVL